MRPLQLFLLLSLGWLAQGTNALAQSAPGRVTGTVATEKGEPLGGASIKASDTRSSESYTIASNEHGMFEFKMLTAGKSYNFTITHIGYAAKVIKAFLVKPNENNSLLVRLSEGSNDLDQFVIVGYGSQKKGNLTGAVTQISGDVLDDKPLPNVSRGLQGVVPNLNITMSDGKPTRSPSYNIRGVTSIGSGGPASALVLIDGVPGDPGLLNPNDVESITVLKDAASAAIYGARGAYGVVLFTTKSSRKGNTQVSFSSNYSVNKRTVDPKIVNDGYEWASDYAEGYLAWYDYKTPPPNINGAFTYTPANMDSLKARSLNPALPKVTVDPATNKYNYFGSTDWFNLLYRNNTPAYDNALSISGSNKNADFYISGRYYNQAGVFRYSPDNFNRYNLRMKGDVMVAPWLTLSDNFDFNVFNYAYPLNNNKSPIWRNMDVSGSPLATMFNPDGSLTPGSYLGVGDFYTGNNKSYQKQLFARNTFSFNMDLIHNWLNLKGDFTYAYTNQNTNFVYLPVSYSVGPGQTGASTNNYLGQSTGITNYYGTNIYAEASHRFDDHSIKLLGGLNVEDNRFDTTYMQRDGIIDGSLPNFGLLNGTNYNITGNGNEWTIMGLFFRANYAYKDKYLLEINGRYDGSSKFPSYSQYGFFPSVSAGWVISRENFMDGASTWLDQLKFRASVGSLGNGQIKPYLFIPTMPVAQSGVIVNGIYPTYTNNPNVLPSGLTWEKSTTVDAGLDFAILKNRLVMSADVYNRYSTGMFTQGQPLPAVFGAAVPKGNNSNLKTSGWELSATWKDNITKDWSYSVGVVLSDNTSVITKFYNPTGILPYPFDPVTPKTYYKGMHPGEIWGFETEGFFKDQNDIDTHADQSYVVVSNSNVPMAGDIKFKDINPSDKNASGRSVINVGQQTLTNHGDLKVIGNASPRYMFGITLGATWKTLSISAFIQGVGHRDWWPGTEAGDFWGQYNRPYESIPAYMMKNVWTETHTNAYFPRYRGYVALQGTRELVLAQTRYLQNAAYARLKNLSLSWTLPKEWYNKLKMTNAKLYFNGQNLFTVSPLHKYAANMDPEVIDSSDPEVNASSGAGYAYPMLKTYTLGLNVTF